MEFEFYTFSRQSPQSGMGTATRVEFESRDEVRFARSCLESFRAYIERDYEDNHPKRRGAAVLLQKCVFAEQRLDQFLCQVAEPPNTPLVLGAVALDRYLDDDQSAAAIIYDAVDRVHHDPRVRRHFPEEQRALLAQFSPELS